MQLRHNFLIKRKSGPEQASDAIAFQPFKSGLRRGDAVDLQKGSKVTRLILSEN